MENVHKDVVAFVRASQKLIAVNLLYRGKKHFKRNLGRRIKYFITNTLCPENLEIISLVVAVVVVAAAAAETMSH
jgi:hypothetical protein